MLLTFILYGFILALLLYIIVNIVQTKKFKIGDAIATLGIIISIVLAPSINPQSTDLQSSKQAPTSDVFTPPPPTPIPDLFTSSPTALSYTPTPQGRLFFDEFDNTSLTKWVALDVTTKLEGGEIYPNNGYIVAGSLKLQNYKITTNVRLISEGGHDFSVVARFTDQNNFYMCQFYNGVLWLQNVESGDTDTLAQNFSGLRIGSNEIIMDVQDNTIACYLNGNILASATDNIFSSGKFGFRIYNTEIAIDNVNVYELP